MLLILKETGEIEQCILLGDTERLAAVYEQHGKIAMPTLEQVDAFASYVENPTDPLRRKVLPRPYLDLTIEDKALRADGVDELKIVAPASCSVAVQFEGATVATGLVAANEPLEFSTDHAGAYTLTFTAGFPYLPTITTIEAIA